jgi:hypothetical protein
MMIVCPFLFATIDTNTIEGKEEDHLEGFEEKVQGQSVEQRQATS